MRDSIEDHPFLWMAAIAGAAFAAGYAAREVLSRDSGKETVLKGSYVLKSQIEGGGSSLYVRRHDLDAALKEIEALRARSAELEREIAPRRPRRSGPSKAAGGFTKIALSDMAEKGSGDLYPPQVQKNRVYWQDQVWVAGRRYDKAIGIVPQPRKLAWIEYRVPAGATRFTGLAGLARDDSSVNCQGHFDFRVLLDGKAVALRKFKGTWMVRPENLDIAVKRNQTLRFEVSDGGDTTDPSNYCDHAVVVAPYFE